MKNTVLYTTFFLLALAAFTRCKKEFDVPPIKQPNDGARMTIAGLKARYNPNVTLKFSGDTNLYCVVIADEASGNLYKDVYVRDATGALHVKLVASGGLFIGDSVRINLNNVLLDNYSSLIQLDSVDVTKNVVKLASGLNPRPQVMTIAQLIANTAATNTVQSQLIQLNNVEFQAPYRNQPYANATTKATVQYTIQECSGNAVAVRTSGYSYFAGQNTPGGNGSIIAIASQFNSTMQLLIRSSTELNMGGTVCGGNAPGGPSSGSSYLTKDFNDNSMTSGGWNMQNVVGAINWSTNNKGSTSNPYAQATNFVSSKNVACETWLISPPVDLSKATNPALSFRNAYNYAGPALTVLVSTNYTGGAPYAATWTPLNFVSSTGAFAYIGSGNIPLSAYNTASTYVAFKYVGTGSAGSTWEIDDITIKEN